MGNYFTTINPPSDKAIVSLFQNLESILEQKASVRYAGIDDAIELNNPLIKSISASLTFRISHMSIGGSYLHITFRRNQCANGVDQETSHPYFCTINVNSSQNSRNLNPKFVIVSDSISEFLSIHHLLPLAGITGGNDIVAPQSAVLSAIQAGASDQIVRTQEFFHELTRRFEDRHKALEAEHAAQMAKLAERAAENDKKIQSERDALSVENIKLEARRKELDDRDNTHARRAIKTELLTTLQARQKDFSISDDTRRLRWPIHVVFLFLLFGTFSGSAWSLYIWGSSPVTSWSDASTVSSIIKSVALAFSFLTSAGLYISWMNRWFDKHADAQFITKQYEIDINRATWAVEAALEWQRAQAGEMPAALVSGITNHLFESERGESQEYSPLEALASSLLGSASSAEISSGGSKVSFDRKSLKNLSK
jgi:hypothetical protein